MNQTEATTRARRQRVDEAIQMAMESRWEDALEANKAILATFPNDTDSYNRLGKALMELGRLNEAKKAYKRALELDPTNQIARKNLERVQAMAKSGAQPEASRVDPGLFIEEMGKTGVTTLRGAAAETLAKLNAGDVVELKVNAGVLEVETPSGELIGQVEPKLGLRLVKLMDGGNEYTAAVASLGDGRCRVIIKETYQHPSQLGRPSFPTTSLPEGHRPYTKESLLRYGDAAEPAAADDGERAADGEESEGWENETEAQEGDLRLYDAAAAEERAAEEDEIEE
jgi:tetratricopeptide (TPR) repeat protein